MPCAAAAPNHHDRPVRVSLVSVDFPVRSDRLADFAASSINVLMSSLIEYTLIGKAGTTGRIAQDKNSMLRAF
jgi:hypothetical protein